MAQEPEYKRIIRIEPHWCNIFTSAIKQTEAVVKKQDGQALISEMLAFGQRLYQAQCEECNRKEATNG